MPLVVPGSASGPAPPQRPAKLGIVIAGDGLNIRVVPSRAVIEGVGAAMVGATLDSDLAGTMAAQWPQTVKQGGCPGLAPGRVAATRRPARRPAIPRPRLAHVCRAPDGPNQSRARARGVRAGPLAGCRGCRCQNSARHLWHATVRRPPRTRPVLDEATDCVRQPDQGVRIGAGGGVRSNGIRTVAAFRMADAGMCFGTSAIAAIAAVQCGAPAEPRLSWTFYAAQPLFFATLIWVEPYDFLHTCNDGPVLCALVVAPSGNHLARVAPLKTIVPFRISSARWL